MGHFICLSLFLWLSKTQGLIWGGWVAERTNSASFELIGGSEYDELRNVLGSAGASLHSELASELTAEYLNSTNVFFTSFIEDDKSDLSSKEQELLVEWVEVKGGVLVIACYSTHYNACRSYITPFGLDVSEHKYGNVAASCFASPADLMRGVQARTHSNAELFVIGLSGAIPLCTFCEGVPDAFLKYGNGYVIFSAYYPFIDGAFLTSDHSTFIWNLVLWTETLECSDNGCMTGIPGQCEKTNCDDSDLCTLEYCDVTNGCRYERVNCDDDSRCTHDSCDPSSGCRHEDVNCDDGNPCTVDTCDELNGCVHDKQDCDDDSECTVDYCNPNIGCSHINAEECYPAMSETAEKVAKLQDDILQIKEFLFHPPSPPTQAALTLLIPTPPPSVTTSNPTPQPTQFPFGEIFTEILQEAMGDMQQFISEEVAAINERMDDIEAKVDRIVSARFPSQTQTPSTPPTPIRTSGPTETPLKCEASDELTRDDFVAEDGLCSAEAQKCFDDTNCVAAATPENCAIPIDVLRGPDKCWITAGYEIPDTTEISEGIDSSGAEDTWDPDESSFESWVDLATCVKRMCGCKNEPGKWSVSESMSMQFATSSFSCCLLCGETENCEKWGFSSNICLLSEPGAVEDNSDQAMLWSRGVIDDT